MDGWTDRQTAHGYTVHCITCSHTVKSYIQYIQGPVGTRIYSAAVTKKTSRKLLTIKEKIMTVSRSQALQSNKCIFKQQCSSARPRRARKL